MPATPARPSMDEMFTMDPAPWADMTGATARIPR
jgi:hypothetical protein